MRSVEEIIAEQHENRMSLSPSSIAMPRTGTPVKLTPRKRVVVLDLLAQGLSQTEVGKRLGLSQSTVARAAREASRSERTDGASTPHPGRET